MMDLRIVIIMIYIRIILDFVLYFWMHSNGYNNVAYANKNKVKVSTIDFTSNRFILEIQ